MRNFYIYTEIDDRETPLKGGPRRKDGGFYQEIRINNNGESEVVMTIQGRVDKKGRLILTAEELGGETLLEVVRKRG